MKFGKARIPYVMIASSKEESVEDECREEGFMDIQNSWEAESVVTTITTPGLLFFNATVIKNERKMRQK